MAANEWFECAHCRSGHTENGREANPELAHETIEAYQIRCKRLIHIYIFGLSQSLEQLLKKRRVKVRSIVTGGHVGSKGEFQEEEDNRLTVTSCV